MTRLRLLGPLFDVHSGDKNGPISPTRNFGNWFSESMRLIAQKSAAFCPEAADKKRGRYPKLCKCRQPKTNWAPTLVRPTGQTHSENSSRFELVIFRLPQNQRFANLIIRLTFQREGITRTRGFCPNTCRRSNPRLVISRS